MMAYANVSFFKSHPGPWIRIIKNRTFRIIYNGDKCIPQALAQAFLLISEL